MVQVKSSDEALILCKTSIGRLKLEINDLPATKVKAPKLKIVLHSSFRSNASLHILNVKLLVTFTHHVSVKQSDKHQQL